MTTGGGVRAAFSPDGGTRAVASADGRLKTFDTGEFFFVSGGRNEKRRRRKRRRHVFFFLVVVVQRPLALCSSRSPSTRKGSVAPPRCLFLSLQLQEEMRMHLDGGKVCLESCSRRAEKRRWLDFFFKGNALSLSRPPPLADGGDGGFERHFNLSLPRVRSSLSLSLPKRFTHIQFQMLRC